MVTRDMDVIHTINEDMHKNTYARSPTHHISQTNLNVTFFGPFLYLFSVFCMSVCRLYVIQLPMNQNLGSFLFLWICVVFSTRYHQLFVIKLHVQCFNQGCDIRDVQVLSSHYYVYHHFMTSDILFYVLLSCPFDS